MNMWKITLMVVKRASLLLFAISLGNTAFAQSMISKTMTDGHIPPGVSPGNPLGSYPVSGIDNINLFNGNVNVSIPIISVGGRGSAGASITVSVESYKWRVRDYASQQFFDPHHEFPPGYDTVTLWRLPEYNYHHSAGYKPGKLVGVWATDDMPPSGYSCNASVYVSKTITRLQFYTPDGTSIELYDKKYSGTAATHNYCSFSGAYNRGKVFVSSDSESITFISDMDISDNPNSGTQFEFAPTGYLLMKNGTRYRILDGNVVWIRDGNGNKVSFSSPDLSSHAWVDSLGRSVTASLTSQNNSYDLIEFSGTNGSMRQIKIWYSPLVQVLRPGFSIKTGADLFPELYGSNPAPYNIGNWQHNPTLISAIELPDGRKYLFQYTDYGEIARVILPTGGGFDYEYEVNGDPIPGMGGQIGNVAGGMVYRRVYKRTTYNSLTLLTDSSNPPSGSIKGIDEYIESYILNQTSTSNDTVVDVAHKNAGGFLLSQERHVFFGTPIQEAYTPQFPTTYSPWRTGREYKVESLQVINGVPGSAISRVEPTWYPATSNQALPPPNPKITETITTLLDSGQVSKISSIDPSDGSLGFDGYNNQTDVWEYDFGIGSPGALIRHTHTTYKTDGYDTIVGGTSNPDPIATIHIRNLPVLQTVQDANGIIRAKTTYEYDGSPLGGLENYGGVAIPGLVSRSGQTQAQGYNPAGDSMRGNVTRVTQYLLANTGLLQPEQQDVELYSDSRYDIVGNVVKVRDAKQNETTFDYSDSFSGTSTANTFAFLKSSTSPAPSAPYGGNLALVTTSVYDFQSGKVVSATDPNGQVTSFEYNDSLDRLTRVVRPTGGGETVFEYGLGDVAANRFIHTKTKQSSSPNVWIEDYGFYDGLGRTWRSAHLESGSNYSVRDSQFDALGRAHKVANPYFITGSVSELATGTASNTNLTVTTFDALGRVTRVTTPDGSHVDTEYLGNKVTATDQAGKKRSSVTDGLGRLIQVNEAPNDPAFNYQTNYTYDILGNLIRVRQGGFPLGGDLDQTVQFRRFYYDSLSRLVFANNPEQDATIPFDPPNETGVMWTMKYEYDANGNLIKRKDARLVEATYGYDTLNRNTTVDYNDGTAAVRRYYDVATSGDGGGAFANGKGRMRRVDSLNTHPTSGNSANSRTVIDSYDNLGRITSQKQGFQTGSNWQYFTTTRIVSASVSGYDLVGHVARQTYPSGNVVLNLYGADGRLNEFQGYLGNQNGDAFTKEIRYDAAGQMLRERFQTSPFPTFHHAKYNNRFQMIETSVGSSSNESPQNTAAWDRGKLRFFYNKQALSTEEPDSDPFPTEDGNNGNVLRQEHWVPTSVTSKPNGPSVVNSYAVPMRDDYSYDAINRLTRVKGWQRQTGSGTPEQIYQQGYDYDKFGNRKLHYSANPSDEYRTWGNGITGSVTTDLYDVNKPTNRLTGMVYDAAGNLRSAQSSLRFDRRDYDAENRMVYAKTGLNPGNYVYDGDGRRVRRIVNGVETWQVYGIDGELLAEYNATSGSPELQKEYGYRNGQLLVVAEVGAPLKWLVADHLGTPRIIVDSTGILNNVRRHDYLPFGEELAVGMGNGSIRTGAGGMGYETDGVRQKFTGYERDDETTLDYAQARYFSNVQGRFTSPDEFNDGPIEAFSMISTANPTIYADLIEPQSLNKYQYSYNNPLRYIDPDGHKPMGGFDCLGCTSGYQDDDFWKKAAQVVGKLCDCSGWSDGETKKEPEHNLMLPTTDKILQGQMDAMVVNSQVLSSTLQLLDPLGATGIYMGAANGDYFGAILSVGGFGNWNKLSKYYQVFLKAYPQFGKFVGKGLLEIHHRIPQVYFRRGLFTHDADSLSNLYALPKGVHRGVVNGLWSDFARRNPNPTAAQVMRHAIEVDEQIIRHVNRIGR